LEASGELPTEATLQAVRTQRDALWQTIRAGARDDTHCDRFATLLSDADAISDRLRHEADRVQLKARVLVDIEHWQRQHQVILAQQHVLEQETQALQSRWLVLWQGCDREPDDPAVMLEWLDAWQQLCELVAQWEELQLELATTISQRTRLLDLLQRALALAALPGLATECLQPLLEHAVEQLEQCQRHEQQQRGWHQQLAQLALEHQQAEQALQDAQADQVRWLASWQDSLQRLGLPDQWLPEQWPALLEQLTDLQRALNDQAALQQQISVAQLAQRQFVERTAQLANQWLDAQWQQRPPDDQLLQLLQLVKQHREAGTQRQAFQNQLAELQQKARNAKATCESMQRQLQQLCQEAGVQQADQLEEAEQASQRLQRYRDEADALNKALSMDGQGLTLAELRDPAADLDVDVDSLPSRVQALAEQINQLRVRQNSLLTEQGREQNSFELMQGGEQAAQLSEQAQGLLAEIRQLSEDYVRHKVAAGLLRQHIERSRPENQGPLVERASAHFRRLTCGRYTHLQVDFNDRDEPVLMGMRGETTGLNVLGMSAGTRDQLYLSLRLAALERYLETSEPLPFIVDDILIEFDDRRSLAALETLAELAQRTQVIVFTHHSRIVEQVTALHLPVSLHQL
jgi:uncharacterized protein YhaN